MFSRTFSYAAKVLASSSPFSFAISSFSWASSFSVSSVIERLSFLLASRSASLCLRSLLLASTWAFNSEIYAFFSVILFCANLSSISWNSISREIETYSLLFLTVACCSLYLSIAALLLSASIFLWAINFSPSKISSFNLEILVFVPSIPSSKSRISSGSSPSKRWILSILESFCWIRYKVCSLCSIELSESLILLDNDIKVSLLSIGVSIAFFCFVDISYFNNNILG